MASLKSFLPVLADIFATTPDALYSRQRALVALKVLEPIEGRGPGSGVPLSARSIGAVVISLLAANTLAEVDDRVAQLCNAMPGPKRYSGITAAEMSSRNTFLDDVASAILREDIRIVSRLRDGPTAVRTIQHARTIRVTRPWRGQIAGGLSGVNTVDYFVRARPPGEVMWVPGHSPEPIHQTSEIDENTFERLHTATAIAVTISENEGGEE